MNSLAKKVSSNFGRIGIFLSSEDYNGHIPNLSQMNRKYYNYHQYLG